MDLREIGSCVDRIYVAQDRDQQRALVNAIMNFRETNFWELLQWLGNYWFLKDSDPWT
jgi:hypothetical protein